MGFLGFGNQFTKEGKGVSKEDVIKHRFIIFFEVIGRKFWKLCLLSLLYIVTSIPALLIYYAASSYIVPFVFGVTMGREAVAGMSGYLVLYSVLFAALLFLLFGSGPASCGAYYVLRNFSKEEHAWVASDFFEHFKKNFGQGMAMFCLNLLVIAALFMNIIFYLSGMAGGINEILRLVLMTMFAIAFFAYSIMQMYIYPMMVTFKLKLRYILQNALLFTFYKLPQNILMLALTVTAFLVMVTLGEWLVFLYAAMPLIGFVIIMLGQTFYTFQVISKAMIKDEGETTKTEE